VYQNCYNSFSLFIIKLNHNGNSDPGAFLCTLQFVFQFYKNGVITDDSCGARGDIDHGVLAVGHGVDQETQEPYFLVKNSWGEKWGDKGFVKMSRKSKNQFGICAILKMASFPEVE